MDLQNVWLHKTTATGLPIFFRSTWTPTFMASSSRKFTLKAVKGIQKSMSLWVQACRLAFQQHFNYHCSKVVWVSSLNSTAALGTPTISTFFEALRLSSHSETPVLATWHPIGTSSKYPLTLDRSRDAWASSYQAFQMTTTSPQIVHHTIAHTKRVELGPLATEASPVPPWDVEGLFFGGKGHFIAALMSLQTGQLPVLNEDLCYLDS